MRFLPALCVLFFSSLQLSAQNLRKVDQCVIENGTLKNVVADYDPATGKYYVSANGSLKSFDLVYPEITKDYAKSGTWYDNEVINVNGAGYSKYGLPRILQVTDVKKTTSYNGVGVYQEAISGGPSTVIYIPTRRGCEFQPYQKMKLDVSQKKFYYDSNWKIIPTATNASYYRIITLDELGNPVGQVNDYFITGEKQWQGYLSYMDPQDNNKDITNGMATWYHKNGRKASEGMQKNGNRDGLFKSWYENGNPEQEIEYSYGRPVGRYKTWYANGKPASDVQYDSSGTFHGKQVFYWEDGRIRLQQTYVNGKPVTPCYNMLESDGQQYEACADFFTANKPVFNWRYPTGPSSHAIEEGTLKLRARYPVSAFALFTLPEDLARLVNISATFAPMESDEYGEAGLVWNVADSANFNFFTLTKKKKWTAGSMKAGKLYGEERDATPYLTDERYQRITLLRQGNNMVLLINGTPVANVPGDFGFKTNQLGLIYTGLDGVRFESFLRVLKK